MAELLESLLKQTLKPTAICVVDNNSCDGTHAFLLEKGFIEKKQTSNISSNNDSSSSRNGIQLYYVRLPENIGCSGGFHEGLRHVTQLGLYDWLWLMDDDVEPLPDCLEKLEKNIEKENVVIPLRIDKNGENSEFSSEIFDLDNPFCLHNEKIRVIDKYKSLNEIPIKLNMESFTFEGPLINISVINKIGYPRKDLFIFDDDIDYAMRIRRVANENLTLISSAKMVRKIPFRPCLHLNNWRTYYMIRNLFYINYKYGNNIGVRLKPYLIFASMLIVYSCKFDYKKLIISLHALLDYKKIDMPNRYMP